MAEDIKKNHEREAKWQKRWKEARAFVPKDDGSKPRFYTLVEFPFLSGAGMHAGHMMNYSGIDVLARFRRARGFDVLFPMGFDAMGIAPVSKGIIQLFLFCPAPKGESPSFPCPAYFPKAPDCGEP